MKKEMIDEKINMETKLTDNVLPVVTPLQHLGFFWRLYSYQSSSLQNLLLISGCQLSILHNTTMHLFLPTIE